MEITYYGANCVVISNKKTRLVVDDNLDKLGLKNIEKDGDILLFTDSAGADGYDHKKAKSVVNSPGEYEISNASIRGIPARAHVDENGKTAIIYKVIIDDTRIAIFGNIYPELSDSQLEDIGTIDILCTPVGGNGYTLDGTGAIGLIKKIEPKIVIPTHYADPKIKYPVPQTDLDAALKAMSMEAFETQDSLKPKGLEVIENTKLIVLNRQS
jgi:L-ascorbate metabolism protein UlaG (beta-lactamase superfamily)